MTMPPLPPAGDTSWRDDWAVAVHDAATQVKDGRLTAANLAETVRDTIGASLAAGASVTITVDDVADTITVSSTAVPPTRTISTTVPLTGGGDLSANRTLAVSTATDAAVGVVELATTAEATAGTDAVRAVTPAGVKAVADTKAGLRTVTTTQTVAGYTFVVGDANTMVEGNSADAQTFTVPADTFTAGDSISIRQYGAGQVTVAAGTGTVARSRGGALKLAGQYAEVTLTFRAANEFVVTGDVVV
jgi:hypothetical protein